MDLAFSKSWWIEWRDAPEIQRALTKAHLLHWVPLVQRKLDENKQLKTGPSSWQALADDLVRSWAAIWRWKTGDSKLAAYDFQCLSSILDVPLDRFFPSIEDQVAAATLQLCVPAILHAEAAAYAGYRFSHPRGYNPHLDSVAVKRVFKKLNHTFANIAAVESAINRTAKSLEPLLQRIGARER